MPNNPIANEMAQIIKGESKSGAKEAVRFPVFGTLDSGLNLLPDGFGRVIPRSDYHVWQPRINLYTRSVPTMDDGSYNTLTQDYRLELLLKPDDRVVCIPIEDGHTFLIIGHMQGGLAP